MSAIKTCCWIKEPAQVGKAAVYCGAPTRFRMVYENDEYGAPKKRQYDSFCDEHIDLALAQARSDED